MSHSRVRSSGVNALRQLANRIADLPRLRGAIAREISQGALPELVDLQFSVSAGPDGVPWAPAVDGSLPPMIRAGELRASYKFSASTTTDGITLHCSNSAVNKKGRAYWRFLNDGTPKMAARRQFPRSAGEGLVWVPVFVEIYRDHIERHLSRVGFRDA